MTQLLVCFAVNNLSPHSFTPLSSMQRHASTCSCAWGWCGLWWRCPRAYVHALSRTQVHPSCEHVEANRVYPFYFLPPPSTPIKGYFKYLCSPQPPPDKASVAITLVHKDGQLKPSLHPRKPQCLWKTWKWWPHTCSSQFTVTSNSRGESYTISSCFVIYRLWWFS
jgi:hypothetical protein